VPFDRHANGSVIVEAYRDIGMIDAQLWDAHCADTDYFKHRYLDALGSAQLNCEWVYFVATRCGKAIGVSFGCVFAYPVVGSLGLKVFTLGSPVNLGFPFAAAVAEERASAFAAICAAARRHARAAGAKLVVLRDFRSEDTPMLAAVGPTLRPVTLYSCAYLVVRWQSFADYAASLKGSERKRLQAYQDEAAVRGWKARVFRGSEARALDPKVLLALWRNIADRKRDRDQIDLTLGYFEAMTSDPSSVFRVLYDGSDVIAFDYALKRGRQLDSIYCGQVASPSRRFSLNRLMGYEIVRYAIAEGLGLINFGISNEQVKKEMGCALEPLQAAIGSPVSGLVGTLITRLMVKTFAEAPRGDKPKSATVATSGCTEPRHAAHVVVIGAGLSGLAAASKLAQAGLTVSVLEAHSSIGGQLSARNFKSRRRRHLTGCNLFHAKFFKVLAREIGVRIPTIEAPIWMNYDGVAYPPKLWPALKQYTRHGLSVWALARAGIRLAVCLMTWWRWRQKTYLDLVRYIGRGSAFITDLLMQYAALNGVPPEHLPARAIAFLADELRPPVFPKRGTVAVAQAMARIIERHEDAKIVTNTRVERLVVQGNAIVGVQTAAGILRADAVISTLALAETNKLIEREALREALGCQEGSAVAAIVMTLDADAPLPRNVHTFEFIAAGVLDQLSAAARGSTPERVSFDLIVPDNLAPRSEDMAATGFFYCPKRVANRDAMIAAIWERLELAFPGLRQSLRWQRVIWPEEYQQVVGHSSAPNSYSRLTLRAAPKALEWQTISGLFQTSWPAPLAIRNSYTAVSTGFAAARAIIRRTGSNRNQGGARR
jgi:phytoene dehydrogenase-like protein